MQTCDVLIVGGGPAGSSCAWRLRQHGCDVLVLDRRNFPRDKTCAGWITPPVVESLALDVADYSTTRTWQPITQFRVGVIGRQPVDVDYAAPVSYGIRRCEFDHYLLQRSGSRLQLGVGQIHWARSGGKWIVNGEIETPLLVGAGGHFCPVARQLGARAIPGATVVTAQEIEFPVSDDAPGAGTARPQRPELYFCEDLAGYGWCFRKQNYLNLGLGRTEAAGLSDHVASFCRYLQEIGTLTCEPPARFHGHAYQLYEYVTPRLFDDGVLLIGDAAGLAYPQSGEGIRPAVESGLMAAEVIAAAGGDYTRDRLAPYARRIEARFGRPRSRGAAGWIPAAWLRALGARLLSHRAFVRRCVLDDWFLHARQPALRLE
jgi:flavin-dependent dehydrogenase